MWRDGGQFSTEKYTSNNDLENKIIKIKLIVFFFL